MIRFLRTAALWAAILPAPARPADGVWPGERWESSTPAEAGLDAAALERARDHALSGGGSGLITRHGRLVMSWGDPKKLYDLKSSTKSFGSAVLSLAILDKKVQLDDRARIYDPDLGAEPASNLATGWLDQITLFHLATQTAGFEKPGGFEPLLFKPGTEWHYSDGGPNWLADCLTLVYRRDLDELMFERVFGPIGISRADLAWRRNSYRPPLLAGLERREFGSGISADVDAMARIGYLHLRGGEWAGRRILDRGFTAAVGRTPPELRGLPLHRPPGGLPSGAEDMGRASDHYGFLWWNNADGTLAGVPRETYWSWGLYDSLIVVMPTLDIVAARAGDSWKRMPGAAHYDVLKPFLSAIAGSAGAAARSAPYPPSSVIQEVRWAPAETIARLARGGDNWPLTWADDDLLYTAYGDARGFSGDRPEKLSLGLARIRGTPPAISGEDLRAPTLEQRGDGPAGRKASGLLMVDGVLYLWARNAGNAQLAWSADHGASWSWSDWKITGSFGCPTFLNFGRNYSGARDDCVYIYSPDSDGAYSPADRMVLARVPRDALRRRETYEFFVTLSAEGMAAWTKDIARRGAVFTHPNRCWRSGITFDAALKRYLWCQVLPQSKHPEGPRFQGGFGIYDAPEPWGPWTTAFFTEEWDVGPGETSCFPTKWMSGDGRILHLVFSGDDSLSVRRATVILR